VDLLADPGERAHPEAAAAVLLGDVDPEVAAAREGVPELAGGLPLLGFPLRVLGPEPRADPGDGLPQQDLLLARDDVERDEVAVDRGGDRRSLSARRG